MTLLSSVSARRPPTRCFLSAAWMWRQSQSVYRHTLASLTGRQVYRSDNVSCHRTITLCWGCIPARRPSWAAPREKFVKELKLWSEVCFLLVGQSEFWKGGCVESNKRDAILCGWSFFSACFWTMEHVFELNRLSNIWLNSYLCLLY